MIDGCGGDICDFELNCTGPGAQRPELTYLSPIIGKQLVCQGACSESYSIQLTHGCGSVMRKWTLDGTTIGSNSNNVKIDFPEAGEFDLCVDVDYSLISLGGSCVQTQQKCMQIKVIKNPDRMGGIRYLCPETKPFLWHNQFIYDSDIYRAEFTGSGCCKFDSVVEFNYLDEPVSPIIYHLSCTPLDSFVDPVSGRSFKTCQNMQPVYLRKSSMPYRCDSLYFLNAAFLDYKLSVSELCQDSLILSAQLKDQSDSCIVPWFKTDIGFKWYMGNDSLRKTISQDTFLRIRESGEFCLEMTARSEFGQKVHECVYQYCRQIQMEDFIPDPVCPFGFSGGHPFYDSYTIELSELPASARNHRWRIEGGTIQSPGHGDDSTTLWVDWDPKASEGKVCYRYANDCFESKECCISVRLISGQTDGYRLDWLKVTPNPFREEFKIWLNLELKLRDLYILDPYGKKIQQNLSYKRVLNGSLSISSSDMRPGVYYLCAETDRGLLVRKVVKL